MTSDGRPYGRFRRAIDKGQAHQAYAAAAELAVLDLADALDLCLVLAAAGDDRFEPAARRWLERLGRDRGAGLGDLAIASAALAELGRRPTSEIARDTLEQLAGR